MKIEILYENDDLLVINKPYGVVVNRAESIKVETVQDWVEEKYKTSDDRSQMTDGEKLFRSRSGVCHRLDKETSGCLIIAKNPKTLIYFLKQFKMRKVKKTYSALVHGKVEPREGGIVLPIKRSLFDREKWQVHYEGKRSVTFWRVVDYFKFNSSLTLWKDQLTLLDIDLKTGRTHQIRVHLSFLGWPIFADDKYLNKKQAIFDREFLSHHFLHAKQIEFKSPSHKMIKIIAPLPVDCLKMLVLLSNGFSEEKNFN